MIAAQSTHRIDIVVPIYNAPDDVRRCVESVLSCTPEPHRLILIDDASTDAGVRDVLREIQQRGDRHVEILRNERNLGFTGTANRGMMHSTADVVLLNSDTIVTPGWLSALTRCAASDAAIATVTPFSNNAEICSFPRFCEDNAWPLDRDPAPVARALADAAVPTYPDLPTGVGFCMFVRRTAIDALGTFDMAFGAGYGEENDFCLRAASAGWRNVLADDAFVVHTGRPVVRRTQGGARRTQSRASARASSALRRDGYALYRRRSLASAARGGADAPRYAFAAAMRSARHPSPWRGHGDARPAADRRIARPVAPLPRRRCRRSLAGRSASG